MRPGTRCLIAVIIIILGCSSPNIATKFTSSDHYIDDYLSGEISSGHLKGVHGLVYQDGQILYDRAFGNRDEETHDPMKGNEEYFIQSMTKPIISVALMTLYEEGKFSLDDPIDKYLPEFSNPTIINNPGEGLKSGSHPAKSRITIASLLSHTSGMSHGLTTVAYDKEIRSAVTDPAITTIEQRVKALAKLPLMYEPGSKWNYSFSTDLLSRLIEVLSGMNTADFLNARIFRPLEMNNTGYNLTQDQQKRLMIVYNFQADSTLKRAEKQLQPSGNTLFAGVNALFSTTHDYLKFAQMLLNEGSLNGKRILKKETLALMRQDYTAAINLKPTTASKFYKLAPGIVIDADSSSNLQPGYGFGLGFGLLVDSAAAENPGPGGEFFWNGANSTYFFINPKLKLIGIFMTQVGFVKNPFHYYFGAKMREAVYSSVLKNRLQ
jgi:CubicO group peptidase (beta-lactamase class C family)